MQTILRANVLVNSNCSNFCSPQNTCDIGTLGKPTCQPVEAEVLQNRSLIDVPAHRLGIALLQRPPHTWRTSCVHQASRLPLRSAALISPACRHHMHRGDEVCPGRNNARCSTAGPHAPSAPSAPLTPARLMSRLCASAMRYCGEIEHIKRPHRHGGSRPTAHHGYVAGSAAP